MDFTDNQFYGRYKGARDAAWQIQIKYKIDSLPVSVMKICKNIGIIVLSYTEAEDIINECDLADHASVNDGFVLYTDKWYILYSTEIIPKESTRFILARELARILLGQPLQQKKIGLFTAYYSNEHLNKEYEEEANLFASRLLSPAVILWALNILEPEKMVELCGLKPSEAQLRAKRMEELLKNNMFLKYSLEKAVFEQYSDYIENYKKQHQ